MSSNPVLAGELNSNGYSEHNEVRLPCTSFERKKTVIDKRTLQKPHKVVSTQLTQTIRLCGTIPAIIMHIDFVMNSEDIEQFLQTERGYPAFRIEPARSGRSVCQKCLVRIMKGDLRIGALQAETYWGVGKYAFWCHLKCWSVPSRVSLALPSAVYCDDPSQFEHALFSMSDTLLSGTDELAVEAVATLVLYVMVPGNWASASQQCPDPPLPSGQETDSEDTSMKENNSIPPPRAPVDKEPTLATAVSTVLSVPFAAQKIARSGSIRRLL